LLHKFFIFDVIKNLKTF